jgi:lipoprotein-anchoring transpeptidase ErfK/SrfK
MRCGLLLILSCLSVPVERAHAAETAATLRSRLAWQIALERVGFSPGIIDGQIGRKTELATREFQRVRGLPQTGRLDAATAAALQFDVAGALATYVVTPSDFLEVGPVPTNWMEKSKLNKLGYESAAAAVAERFHCTIGLLARLNPGCNLAQLGRGEVLQVPAVAQVDHSGEGARVEINLLEKVVRVMNGERELVALFHCSIAKDKARLPSGEAHVEVIAEDPSYTFDPRMWPEVKGIDRKLLIPPGPRNPVGRCWIGLSLPGYGVHGSPNPELIGKTGSHGCFRLTNWDALRLAKMIRVGTRVTFVGTPQLAQGN